MCFACSGNGILVLAHLDFNFFRLGSFFFFFFLLEVGC